jgi:hypothetical protein
MLAVTLSSDQSAVTLTLYGLCGLAITGLLILRSWRQLRGARLGVRDGVLAVRFPRREQVISRKPNSVEIVRIQRLEDPGNWVQIWSGPERSVAFLERIWSEERLRALAAQIGADFQEEPKPRSVREIAQTYPGTLPWYAAHPVSAGILLAVVVIGAIGFLDRVG